MTALAIALFLFVAALVVFAIDLMIPTGGVLIAVTAILGFGAVVFAFRHSPVSGLWMLVATLGLIPIMLFTLLVIWPRTPFGKRMITVPERAGDFNWSDAATADLKQVIGATGIADTEFLPHGTVRIGDRLFEAVSESGPIDPGQSVRVTRLDVGRLVVVPLRSRPGDAATMSEGSGLDRPISELDLDSLE
ncbi:MAG: NfeD family protein [Planctomycetota bacterium]|jgi:membrane-bound ClpP family serine protease